MQTVHLQQHTSSSAAFRPFLLPYTSLRRAGARCRAGGKPVTAPTEVSTAVRFAPTRVRVQHDTFIRSSRAAIWALLQEVTPARRWPQVAVVLATLEAIYGVEYQGLAQQLLTAFQQTARPAHSTPAATATAAAITSLQQQQQVQAQPQTHQLTLPKAASNGKAQAGGEAVAAQAAAAAAGTPAAVVAVDAVGDVDGDVSGLWDHLHGTPPPSALTSIDWAEHSSSSSSSSSVRVVTSAAYHDAAQQQQQQQGRSVQLSPAAAATAAAVGDELSSRTQQQQSSSSGPAAAANGSTASGAAGIESSLLLTPDAAMEAVAAAAATAAAVAAGSSPAVVQAAAKAAAAAEVADAAFMELLLLLAAKAGFVGLSERDVQLGISLNTDYLWQLFVKVNTEQLDDQLVSPFMTGSETEDGGGGGADSSSNSSNSNSSSSSNRAVRAVRASQQTPHSLMVLRRGYSSEVQRGRWLLQKLDYLQLLLIKRGFTGLMQLSRAAAQQGGRVNHTLKGLLTPHHSSSSSKGSNRRVREGSRNGRSSSSSVKQQQGNGKAGVLGSKVGSGAAGAAASNGATRKAGAAASSSSSNVSRVRRAGWLRTRWEAAAPADDAAPATRTDSFGRPFKAPAADSTQQLLAVPLNLSSQPGSSNGSSSEAAVLTAPEPAVLADTKSAVSAKGGSDLGSNGSSGAVQQQQQQEEELQQQVEQLEQQVEQQQQLQLQQPRRQRRRPSLLSRLKSRVQDSLSRAAYTLSDWGLIPRMDVVPLERFEAEFPLREAGRLQPLYIEKATLPDILDPVLQSRLPWLGPPDDSSSERSSSGSSSSDDAISRWNGADGGITQHLQATAADGSTRSDDQRGIASTRGRDVLRTFIQPVEIVEPTFRQLLVVYRRKPRVERWKRLRERLTGKVDTAPAARREPIQLQVYRDIPLPSWQVVYPDKLLQFRPLDLLRLDLFGVAGATAALAQAKYNSIVLQLLTLVSLSVWATRLVLGYLRMDDRYKSIVAQLLADRTVASGEGGLEYIATAAGLQQFKQTALAYVLLAASEGPCGEEQVAVAAEALLQHKLQLQVRFNAAEALSELKRFGLLVEKQQQQQHQHAAAASRAASPTTAPLQATATPHRAATAAASHQLQQQLVTGGGPQQQQQQQPGGVMVYSVLGSSRSHKVLQQYWAGLLKARVGSILQDTGMASGGRGLGVDADDEPETHLHHLT